jgi:hypothetical protein
MLRPQSGCGPRISVMLSGAKHLQYLIDNNEMQILRFAQDDRCRDFFRSLQSLSAAVVQSISNGT